MYPDRLCEAAFKILERNPKVLERHPLYKESQRLSGEAEKLADVKLNFEEYGIIENAGNFKLGVYFEVGYIMGLQDGMATARQSKESAPTS